MAAGDAMSSMYNAVKEGGKLSARKLHDELKQLHITLSVEQIEDLVGAFYKENKTQHTNNEVDQFRSLMDEIFLYHEAYTSFKLYDVNGDNKINGAELIPACRNLSKVGNVEDFINTFDVNKDGVLDIDEFAKAYATKAREHERR